MRITGKFLNEKWKVGAAHALYNRPGTWYHPLLRFPGALFDQEGYLVFDTQATYERCPQLTHNEKSVHVRHGIARIPGYVIKGLVK